MKRKQIVAGNWKMNMNFDEGRDLAISIIRKLGPLKATVIFCPPYIHLNYLSTLSKGLDNLYIGAQNCHENSSGAYTGEISAGMLRSVGCQYVILGHSERREYYGEKDELLAKKVDAALAQNLYPIFCVGEKLESREVGEQEKVVEEQLRNGIFHLDKEQFANVVIAYEPVWAIGTGKTASPEQAQEMHAFIRKLIAQKYGQPLAEATSILYGGSVKPDNAKEIFSQPDVDGGLIGGASLKAPDFVALVNSFPND
jgi:triosephosphate isomerase